MNADRYNYWSGTPVLTVFLGIVAFVTMKYSIPLHRKAWEILRGDMFVWAIGGKLVGLYLSERKFGSSKWLSNALSLLCFLMLGLSLGVVVCLSAIYKY